MQNTQSEITPTRRASPGDLPFSRGGRARVWQVLALLPKVLLAGLLILAILAHRFPERIQQLVTRINYWLIAGFGLLTAIFGWRLAAINSVLLSPALEINLAWLYLSAAVGGALIAFYAAGIAIGLIERKPATIEGP